MKLEDISENDLLLIQGGSTWRRLDRPTTPCYICRGRVYTYLTNGNGLGFDGCLGVGDVHLWSRRLNISSKSAEFAILAVKYFDSIKARGEYMVTREQSRGEGIEWDWEMRYDNRYRDIWPTIHPYWKY